MGPRAPVETIGVYHLVLQDYKLQGKYMHYAQSTTTHQNRLSWCASANGFYGGAGAHNGRHT